MNPDYLEFEKVAPSLNLEVGRSYSVQGRMATYLGKTDICAESCHCFEQVDRRGFQAIREESLQDSVLCTLDVLGAEIAMPL